MNESMNNIIKKYVNESPRRPGDLYVNVGLGKLNLDKPKDNTFISDWMAWTNPMSLVFVHLTDGRKVAIAGSGSNYSIDSSNRLLHSQDWKEIGRVSKALNLPMKEVVNNPDVNKQAKDFLGTNSVTLYSFD